MKRVIYLFAVLMSMFAPVTTAATNDYQQALNKLNKALKDKDYELAYDLSDKYTFDYGGLPQFDLLAGISAYGFEKYQEAIFAFERVVIEKPSSFLARFYLAQSYRKVNNLHAAITELENLLQKPLLDEQKSKAENLLSRINRELTNRKRSWGHNVALGMAIDDNVNSGTSEDTIFIPDLGEIQLFDSAKKTSDMSYQLSYQGHYQHPFTQNQWLKANVKFTHIDYLQYSEYKRDMLSLSLAYEHNFNFGLINSSIYTKPLFLDGQDFRTENGLSFGLKKDTSRTTSYNINTSYSIITKDENSELDLVRTKASFTYFLRAKQLHTFMLHGYTDVSDNALYNFNDREVFGGMYQITFPIADKIVNNNFILYESHDYNGAHPVFGISRSEELAYLSTQLIFNSTEKLRLKLFVNAQNKTSNLNLYNYNRTEIGATWHYEL